MPKRTTVAGTTFAYAYGISRKKKDDWFDPKLHTDTALFVDPFLMFDSTSSRWTNTHARMIDFFNEALGLIAAANGNHQSKDWERAAAMLSFPEPPQFCLGYSKKTIFGSGSGKELGQIMLESGERAIRSGIRNITEFGELMLFGNGFSADRISDMVCNIIMDDFAAYTSKVAQRHSIPTELHLLPHLGYDFANGMWRRKKLQLPTNPCWSTRTPVLLVPEEFLSELPAMADHEFWDWVYANFGDQLRTELNMNLNANVNKAAVVARAKQSPSIARRYGIRYAQKLKTDPPAAYDLNGDPSALTKPLQGAQLFALEAKTGAPSTAAEFDSFIGGLIADFKWIAEQRKLWKNFWAGDQPIDEPVIGTLFDTAVVLKCKDMNIDVTRESDAGRGPVDFKFSAGWEKRSIVEIKFAKSKSYWDNLEKQPSTYAGAEGITSGTFLVIQHYDQHCTAEFESKTRKILEGVNRANRLNLKVVFVDVRAKETGSKIKKDLKLNSDLPCGDDPS